ncbi:MAG: hypothetical protein P0S96_03570 [Simkaniaceae bacterium]|nr:hypothetical protein [Candidatus Sacchlamyda saccharinae]
MLLLFFLLFSYIFPPIEETIPEGPFSYPGKSPREVILVDPNRAPLLNQATQTLLQKTEEEILKTVICYVQEELFDLENSNETELWDLIGKQESFPDVSLEIFLDAKTGVCRHYALTTTYLIQQLINEGILKGEIFLIREEIPQGRHAWTLFLSEHGAWHLDAYWGVLENGKTDAGFSKLCHKYSKRVMERYEH